MAAKKTSAELRSTIARIEKANKELQLHIERLKKHAAGWHFLFGVPKRSRKGKQ